MERAPVPSGKLGPSSIRSPLRCVCQIPTIATKGCYRDSRLSQGTTACLALNRAELGLRTASEHSALSGQKGGVVAKNRLPANRPPPANNLLAALPTDAFDRISASLDVVPLPLKKFLYKAHEPITQVYFPGGGFVSVVTELKDGAMVEVATIGREGMLGATATLNGDPSNASAMVQAETDICYRMPIEGLD